MPLTWKRYFREPGLRHRCPRCHGRSKLEGTRTNQVRVLRALGILAGGVPAGLIALPFGPWPGLIGFVLGSQLTGLPFDKRLDVRFGWLVPIPGERPPGEEANCVQCGDLFKRVDMIAHEGHYACARCKPVFLQKLSEGARIETRPENSKPVK